MLQKTCPSYNFNRSSQYPTWLMKSYWWFLLLLLSCFSSVRLSATQRWQPTRLCRLWDSPGKNNEVSCHFLLQCIKVKSERGVAQSCPTLSDPIHCSPPDFSIHGIFQARVLERGAIAFSNWWFLEIGK